MQKIFCDVCGTEMNKTNTPFEGENSARLIANIKRNNVVLKVEVMHSTNGTANKGDVCKHCILDALYALDDRPKAAAA